MQSERRNDRGSIRLVLSLNHKRLDVWKLAIELVTEIYQLTERFPKSETYGIQSAQAGISLGFI